MYRKSRFLVTLAASAITFGCLWFSLGSDNFNRGHKFSEREHCGTEMCGHQRPCYDETKVIHADKVVIINDEVKTDSIVK